MSHPLKRLPHKRSRQQARQDTQDAQVPRTRGIRLIPPKSREPTAIRPIPNLTIIGPTSRANRLATQLRR